MWLGMDEDKTNDTGMDNLAAGWAPTALHDHLMLMFYATNTTTQWQNKQLDDSDYSWKEKEEHNKINYYALVCDLPWGSHYNLHANKNNR